LSNDDLPNQLKWRKFCAVLTRLEYKPGKSHGGSSRNFFRLPNAKKDPRLPELVTFHKPHGSDPIRPGTLRSYINKLHLKHNEFLDLLGGVVDEDEVKETEEQFVRRVGPDGKIASNCAICLNPVANSIDELDVITAELDHRCPIS